MGELVKIYSDNEPRVSTFNIYKQFGYKEHRTLKRVIADNIQLFEAKGEIISASVDAEIKKAGRPDESYFLNERQFITLVMLVKNTPESVELKDRIEVEFYRMREKLSKLASAKSNDFDKVRSDGKAVYHQKTDVIKKFVEYATAQGSKSASMYYMNLAKMENSALFFISQKYPNVRDILNIRQLMQVSTADQIVEKALEDGMNDNLNYKDIYILAKDRVVKFSEIIGKSQVLALEENSVKKLK